MEVADVRAPDESAEGFADATEPFLDALSRRARRLTHSDADAEDLVQDTLLHAYIGFHTFQRGSNLKAWLFRILYNRWVSTYRAKQSRPSEVPVDDVTERDLAHGISVEAAVVDAMPDSRITAAMTALPDGFGAVVYYADVQGYTYAETAAILDIPIGTVMSRASRARQRLRAALIA